jgi:HEAT repeat protein
MTRFLRSAALAAALASCLAGCGKPKPQELTLSERTWGVGKKRMVDLATDPDDADRRRLGIALLSDKEWGRREPYLAWFANRLEVDRNAPVRAVSARALGRAGEAKYLPQLVKALGDSSAMVRCDAAVALASVRGEEAVAPLRKAAAEDASLDVKCAAIRALRHYPRPEVVASLVYCLSDDSFEVRQQAHAALVEMTGRDMGTEAGDWSGAAGGKTPLRAPAWNRPWWDWFGTTRPPSAAQTAPAK